MTTVIQFPEVEPSLTLDQRISREVRALMGRHNVSQMQLAAWLGLAQTAVSARLRNATDWKTKDIERIAEGFLVHPASLMGGYATGGPTPGPGAQLPIVVASGSTNRYPLAHLDRAA